MAIYYSNTWNVSDHYSDGAAAPNRTLTVIGISHAVFLHILEQWIHLPPIGGLWLPLCSESDRAE